MKTNSEKINPFPGLRPFNPEDSDYFYGRETESEEIFGKLLNNRFVAIIGASAAGKSSLINCGLLPKICSISSNGTPGWMVYSLKPGNDPVASLAKALMAEASPAVSKSDDYDKILGLLKDDPYGLTKLLGEPEYKSGKRVLIVIDQFEELFRYGSLENNQEREGNARQFVNLITNVATENTNSLFIVIAIRSDLIAECAQYKKLTRLINDSNYFIPAMSRENLQKVIEAPVLKAGAKIDPKLVDALINDVYERSDCLPVLQHALMRTWSKWTELDEPLKPLTYSDYESIGTIKDAISRHGNSIYEKFSPEGKEICEKLFKVITGKGPDNKGIRHPMQLKTIMLALDCSEAELINIIGKFRDPSVSFLYPSSGVALDSDSIIDLTHESLMHLWDRLQIWIDEEAYSVQMYLRLSEASELYQMGKKTLLRQPDLQLAIDWREKSRPGLLWAQKYNPAFERAMVYLRTSEKEFLESEERKARQHKWRLRRIKIISSILGSLVLLVSLAMAGVFLSKLSAEKRYRAAERQKSEMAAQKNLADEFATLAIRKSIESDSVAIAAARKEEMERSLKETAQTEAYTAKIETDHARKNSREAEYKAKAAIEQSIEIKRLRMISIAKSMSLRSIQVKDQKDLQALLAYQAYLFNKKNNGQPNDADIYQGLYTLAKENNSDNYKIFNGHKGQIRDLAFIPGKKEFFTSGSDGKILKWNLSNKEQTYQVIFDNSEIFGVIEVSPDAGWLACGGENSEIKMIPLNGNGIQYNLKGHSDKIKSLVFSFDGKYLYSASLDGKVLKWDLSARTSMDLSTGVMKIISIDLSSSDKYIAGITPDGKALVWNPKETGDNFRIEPSGRAIKTIRFKPNEERIALGYDDGNVEIWDIPSRRLITGFKAHQGDVSEIRFNKKPEQVATSGIDGSLKIWDSGDFTAIPVSLTDNGGLVLTFEFNPDGDVIVTGDISEKKNLVARPAYADAFAADGCLYVTRNFTPDEWLAYVGKDIEYENTCPDRNHKIKIREIR
jgi:WD40 repeat protein